MTQAPPLSATLHGSSPGTRRRRAIYRRNVDLTVEGDTVATIGPAETADHADAVEIDGRGFAVLPGFVAPVLGAEEMPDRRGRQPPALYELALRIPAAVCGRCRGQEGCQRGGALRAAAERRHHPLRPFRRARGLARHAR